MVKKDWFKTALTLIFIIFSGILYSCNRSNNQEPKLTLQNNIELEDNPIIEETSLTQVMNEQIAEQEDIIYIYVHLCGAVTVPDVYEVKDKTRLVEVIELAGGLLEDAAGDYVNQAAIVEDGQRIYIPTKLEVLNHTTLEYGDSESSSKSDKVNINTASVEELMTLAGIGESKAKSIINYREEHNGFKSIEDIKNINGIKDSVYNKISDMITIN